MIKQTQGPFCLQQQIQDMQQDMQQTHNRASPRQTGQELPRGMAPYWRPMETGSKQIRPWDKGYRVIGTSYLQLGCRIKKQEAGNAHPPLQPKTGPDAAEVHHDGAVVALMLLCPGRAM